MHGFYESYMLECARLVANLQMEGERAQANAFLEDAKLHLQRIQRHLRRVAQSEDPG